MVGIPPSLWKRSCPQKLQAPGNGAVWECLGPAGRAHGPRRCSGRAALVIELLIELIELLQFAGINPPLAHRRRPELEAGLVVQGTHARRFPPQRGDGKCCCSRTSEGLPLIVAFPPGVSTCDINDVGNGSLKTIREGGCSHLTKD